jgi:hypothetical protein
MSMFTKAGIADKASDTPRTDVEADTYISRAKRLAADLRRVAEECTKPGMGYDITLAELVEDAANELEALERIVAFHLAVERSQRHEGEEKTIRDLDKAINDFIEGSHDRRD